MKTGLGLLLELGTPSREHRRLLHLLLEQLRLLLLLLLLLKTTKLILVVILVVIIVVIVVVVGLRGLLGGQLLWVLLKEPADLGSRFGDLLETSFLLAKRAFQRDISSTLPSCRPRPRAAQRSDAPERARQTADASICAPKSTAGNDWRAGRRRARNTLQRSGHPARSAGRAGRAWLAEHLQQQGPGPGKQLATQIVSNQAL